MAKTTTPKTNTFSSTPAGREKAIAQAKRQGESSITFQLKTPKPTKASGKK